VTLLGDNTYTGGTVVDGGTLQFAGPNSLPANTSLTVENGGVVDLGNNDFSLYPTVRSRVTRQLHLHLQLACVAAAA
jgi:autotransporter-associated beta strand protein